MECGEWFDGHGSLVNNIEAGVHFYTIYFLVKKFVSQDWWDVLTVVGELESGDHVEPVYKVGFGTGISLLVWFDECGIEFSVLSISVLLDVPKDLFDVNCRSQLGNIMFSRNSYNQSRLDFSGSLRGKNQLAELISFLMKAG